MLPNEIQQYIQEEKQETPLLVQLAVEMLELKRELEHLEDTKKPLQARYDELRKKLLPDAMTAAGISNFKLSSGGTVYISNKISASVREDDRQNFYAWLRDNGHAGLITPNVHPSTLTAWVKEQIENGNAVSPLVRLYEEPMAILKGVK